MKLSMHEISRFCFLLMASCKHNAQQIFLNDFSKEVCFDCEAPADLYEQYFTVSYRS